MPWGLEGQSMLPWWWCAQPDSHHTSIMKAILWEQGGLLFPWLGLQTDDNISTRQDLLKHSSTLLKYKYKVIHMLRCNLMFFVVCITFWLHWPTQQSTGLIPGLCMRLGLYFGEHSYFGVTPRRQSSILQPANFWRKQLPKISENICRNILR